MGESRFWPIVPVPAPRQVRSDKWKPRPGVVRYRAYRDEIRLRRVWAPTDGDLVVFLLPIPSSWSQKQQRAADGQPHRQKPDTDNLLKALLDATYAEDAHLWTITPAKVWSSTPGILIARRDPLVPIPFRP